MYYIRLLRPASILTTPDERVHFCEVLLTITTDLGDHFYAPCEPLPLSFVVDHAEGRTEAKDVTGRVSWQAGMRVMSLRLRIPVPNLFRGRAKLRIFATSQPVQPRGIDTRDAQLKPAFFFWNHGLREPRSELIIPCHYNLQKDSPQEHSFRSLPLRHGGDLTFEEELGESIARHLWDAGVITASFLGDKCGTADAISSVFPIASDKDHIRVLELGCGIGVLGITIAAVLKQMAKTQGCKGPTMEVLLTDVDDAEDRASSNIAAALGHLGLGGQQSTVKLAYENLDWAEGRLGIFGPRASQQWDYVVLSDCTYNVDSFPALVGTLSAIHAQNCTLAQSEIKTRVLLATKPRHSSEESLFEILDQEGWQYRVTKSIPIFRVDEENEVVEIYMLEKGNTPAPATSSPTKRKTPEQDTAESEAAAAACPSKKPRT